MRRRSLPFEDWPAPDQALWRQIMRTGDILDGSGPGARWMPSTKTNTLKAYAYWLQWLKTTGQLDSDIHSLDRFTPERIRAYLDSREGEIAPLTAFVYILDLLRLAQAADRLRDWQWLKDIKNRLWARAHPVRDKASKIRPSSELFELGLKLMTDADGVTCPRNPFAKEVLFRDGLIIAILAARPIRLKNLTAIGIGQHLVKIDQTYWLIFQASEVKNAKHIEVSLPEVLTIHMDTYLESHRPRLLQGKSTERLWISQRGNPMADNSIRGQIKTRTEIAFGTALTPHLFRDCAATSVAIEDPDHVRIAASILGHYRLATTQRYYDQSQMLAAGRHYQSALIDLRRAGLDETSGDNIANHRGRKRDHG